MAIRERWEKRLQALIHSNGGGWLKPTEIENTSTDYSNEQAALVYRPVYVPEAPPGPPPTPFAIDGVTGEFVLYRARRADGNLAVDLREPLPGLAIGGFGVAGLFVVLSALWLARHLWWY